MARSGDLPPSATTSTPTPTLSRNPLTSFTMNLRDPSPLEGPLDLARFLITSLTFMRTIRKIDMLVDDVAVLEVEKSVKGKERVGKKGMRDTSGAGMMKVKTVEETGMRIDVKVMRWLSSEYTCRDRRRWSPVCMLVDANYQILALSHPLSPRPSRIWSSRLRLSPPSCLHPSSIDQHLPLHQLHRPYHRLHRRIRRKSPVCIAIFRYTRLR